MTTPQQPQDDPVVQVAAGLADTPMGQRVAIMITCLLPKEAAAQVGEAVTKLAEGMSASGLVVAGGNGHAVAQHQG